MIGVPLAERLLNFGARNITSQRANEQLEGAVALHNLLKKQGVAYLADEVGMGKTLVALGVIALFRHFDPRFRVLVISPRENIQIKWAKEMRTFVARNVRFADLRVRGFGDLPARPLVHVSNLTDLLRETALDANRDFFARLTSFSLPLGVQEESWERLQRALRDQLPWLADEALSLKGAKQRKDNFARALCCALPQFDLVIVDEAHNLKHGFKDDSAARNRVLALALGHPNGAAERGLFNNYGSRAAKVLFLSATPVDEHYRQLWNQLDVFGLGEPFRGLQDDELDDEAKKQIAARFLIRRVTAMRVGSSELTKNQYRRQWNRGGVAAHDEPVRIEGDRQRLVVALVQKKVSELLGSEKFGNRYQIGMLASFESFLETTKLKKGEEELSNFDDADQAEGKDEREGIDVHDVNRLARSHRETFDREMPHPKMDAMVARLGEAWDTGTKALVFVRRVASVKELKLKLDELYDLWLKRRLEVELPGELLERFGDLYRRYKREKAEELATAPTTDQPKADTFFAWFFRGEGPRGVISGANIQQRFTQSGAALSTFFDDNYVAWILAVRPGVVLQTMASVLEVPETALSEDIQRRAKRFVGKGKRIPRRLRFEAAQAAATQILSERAGPWQALASIVWEERFSRLHRPATLEAPSVSEYLEMRTFFTELREHPELRREIWPVFDDGDARAAFRAAELRAILLGRTARLGHAFIDLYVMMMGRIRNFDQRALEDGEDDGDDGGRIEAYLQLLERQRTANGPWRAFHELRDTGANFELIMDVNIPEARTGSLLDVPRAVGELMGEQQPIGGMAGQVNHTLVKQFRMPGYPLALVTTDLLQEGEDLHTFCSAVYHYGISWTPSAMEQRIGRIDRVGSHTERRLTRPHHVEADADLLQVYFPHLEDTVEVLQVRRVLERMNAFLRLMHQGLGASAREERQLDVAREIVGATRQVERITSRLVTAFPVLATLLVGTKQRLDVTENISELTVARFQGLRAIRVSGSIEWHPESQQHQLFGTVTLDSGRRQPFALYLRTYGERLVVRCLSPIGRVNARSHVDEIKRCAREIEAQLGAIADEDRSYDLTVEEDSVLGAERVDLSRVATVVKRVVHHADELEQHLLEGIDQGFRQFKDDLGKDHGAHN